MDSKQKLFLPANILALSIINLTISIQKIFIVFDEKDEIFVPLQRSIICFCNLRKQKVHLEVGKLVKKPGFILELNETDKYNFQILSSDEKHFKLIIIPKSKIPSLYLLALEQCHNITHNSTSLPQEILNDMCILSTTKLNLVTLSRSIEIWPHFHNLDTCRTVHKEQRFFSLTLSNIRRRNFKNYTDFKQAEKEAEHFYNLFYP